MSHPAFRKAIEVILRNWNALQFSVQQQTGGHQSKEIATWMEGAVEQYFYENDDLSPEEVGDFIATLMDQELNTQVEDHSEEEIGGLLCRYFRLCLDGLSDNVLQEISNIPNIELSGYTVQEDSDKSMESGVEEGLSGLQLAEGSEMIEDPPRELTELEKQHLQDEADGWTVIKKGNKKR